MNKSKICIHSEDHVAQSGYCSLASRACPMSPLCPYYRHEKITDICEGSVEDDYSKQDSKSEKSYCKYCFNARIYEPTEQEMIDPFNTELTDDNDSSSCGVGHCFNKSRRFMINSGNGKPVNIEFEEWSDEVQRWYTVGRYYPKYCPECGRRLDEYDKERL